MRSTPSTSCPREREKRDENERGGGKERTLKNMELRNSPEIKQEKRGLSRELLFRELLEVLHLENQTIVCWLFKIIFY